MWWVCVFPRAAAGVWFARSKNKKTHQKIYTEGSRTKHTAHHNPTQPHTPTHTQHQLLPTMSTPTPASALQALDALQARLAFAEHYSASHKQHTPTTTPRQFPSSPHTPTTPATPSPHAASWNGAQSVPLPPDADAAMAPTTPTAAAPAPAHEDGVVGTPPMTPLQLEAAGNGHTAENTESAATATPAGAAPQGACACRVGWRAVAHAQPACGHTPSITTPPHCRRPPPHPFSLPHHTHQCCHTLPHTTATDNLKSLYCSQSDPPTRPHLLPPSPWRASR